VFPFTVRPVRADDPVAAHIRAIYEEHGLTYDPGFEDDLDDVPGHYARGAFWVAEDRGVLVGTGGVVANGWARVFKRIYIAPAARRTGLARHLVRMACAWGEFDRTELWSDVRFRGAHRLYLAEGFTMGGTRVLEDPDRSVERYFWRAGDGPRTTSPGSPSPR
jgi:GNAT superfamily N-acetyltransferase